MINYKNKINIDYINGTKLNKDEIAFAFYCKTQLNDLSVFCNHMYHVLFLGKWILSNSNVNMYVVNNDEDILDLENINIDKKKEYNKVVYIKYEDINSDTVRVKSYRKIFDYKEQDETKVSSGYKIDNIDDYGIYISCERKIDNGTELSPYCSNVIDNNNLVSKDIFIKIEEIFAKENYKKNLLKLYNLLSNNKLCANLGFSYSIILNEEYKNNMDKTSQKSLDIKEHIDAIKKIYSVIYDKELEEKSSIELNKYIAEIESKLGNYIEMYLVEDDNAVSINPFYMNFGVWCIRYQNALLIISHGSDE